MTIDFHLDAPTAACCFKASALSGVLTVDAQSLPELEDKIRDVVLKHYRATRNAGVHCDSSQGSALGEVSR